MSRSSARGGRAPIGRLVATSATALMAAAALTGCSVHASIGNTSKVISADKLATTAEDALEPQLGARPDISCPDDLKLAKGETTNCDLTDPATGTVYNMTATVNDPDSADDAVRFHVDGTPKDGAAASDNGASDDGASDDGASDDDAPATLAGDKVATLAEDALEKSVGSRPEIECPDDITLTVGETTRCELTDSSTGDTMGMTATVQSPEADGSGLYFQVDDAPQG